MDVLLTGAITTISTSATRCHGDEERHHFAGGGPVSQDLHTETRASQVSVYNLLQIYLSSIRHVFLDNPPSSIAPFPHLTLSCFISNTIRIFVYNEEMKFQ